MGGNAKLSPHSRKAVVEKAFLYGKGNPGKKQRNEEWMVCQ
jgi:hypothetical protein